MESDCNANKAKTYTLMKNDKYNDKKKVKKRMSFFFTKGKTYLSTTNWDSRGDALRDCETESPVRGRL